MRHRDRILRAIKGEALDYLPSQIDFTNECREKIRTAWGWNGEDVLRETDNHIVIAYPLSYVPKFSSDSSCLEELERAGFARVDRQRGVVYDPWSVGWSMSVEGPFVIDHPLRVLSSYKSYQFPDPDQAGLVDDIAKQVKRYGHEYFVLAGQSISLFERAWALRGYENFMMDLVERPNFAEELLDRIVEYQVAVAKRFVEAGVDGCRTTDDYGTQTGLQMSVTMWRRFFKKRLARIWAVYKEANLVVCHHSCGNILPLIKDLIEIGMDVLHPLQPLALSIEKVKEQFGSSVVLWGGIDTQELLPRGTPSGIRRGVEKCIRILGRNGGYIIGPSQTVMTDVPLENIRALINAVREYRGITCGSEPGIMTI